METLANVVISFFELVEAEGRVMRKNVVVGIECFLLIFFGASFVFFGAIAAAAALYMWLSSCIGKPLSALLIAFVMAGVGLAMISKGHIAFHAHTPQKSEKSGGVSAE
ncbi:MAG: hypothetical protein RR214_07100 [Synergistaceae bacterium]